MIAKYNAMQNAFSDAPEEGQEFLRNFGFICMLSFDVYIKKMMIETLIDFNSQQRKEAADQAKEKRINHKSGKHKPGGHMISGLILSYIS